jgi:hypothetical protein
VAVDTLSTLLLQRQHVAALQASGGIQALLHASVARRSIMLAAVATPSSLDM